MGIGRKYPYNGAPSPGGIQDEMQASRDVSMPVFLGTMALVGAMYAADAVRDLGAKIFKPEKESGK